MTLRVQTLIPVSNPHTDESQNINYLDTFPPSSFRQSVPGILREQVLIKVAGRSAWHLVIQNFEWQQLLRNSTLVAAFPV